MFVVTVFEIIYLLFVINCIVTICSFMHFFNLLSA